MTLPNGRGSVIAVSMEFDMKKNLPNIDSLRDLHRNGQFDEAKAGYLQLLREKPNDPELLHRLGIIAAQQENYSDAIDYLHTAIQHQPNDPALQLHLANSLKAQGQLTQAAQLLQKTVEAHPNYVAAYNNLGTVYYSLGKLTDATHYYQLAIEKKPDYIDAYYNLGLALTKQNQFVGAASAFQTILQYNPEHFPARFHLASALMRDDKIDEALKHFIYIEENHPPHFETEINMATCFLKKGDLNEAKLHYRNALEFSPEDIQILFNLGVINAQLGAVDSAIQHYQRLLHINPDYFPAHNNLGVAFLAKQHVGFALRHFQEALRIQPNNVAIQHTIKVLSQNQHLLASPPDYITSLFDAYADHYDSHLLNALDYQVPDILYKAIKKCIALSKQQWEILDIGCGTGLSGSVFKPHAKKLMGVDLSSKMLDIAKQKNIYDELITQEAITYLAENKNKFDLVIAGDVLVYIGDLKNTLKNISESLHENGWFVFNTEISESADFTMNQSGRFSHQKSYIETLAHQFGLNVIEYQTPITRQQNNEPVYGHVFVLRKK